MRCSEVFPRGDRVVTLSSARRLVIWCAATGEMLQHFEAVGFDEHRSVRVLEDGAKLVTGASRHPRVGQLRAVAFRSSTGGRVPTGGGWSKASSLTTQT